MTTFDVIKLIKQLTLKYIYPQTKYSWGTLMSCICYRFIDTFMWSATSENLCVFNIFGSETMNVKCWASQPSKPSKHPSNRTLLHCVWLFLFLGEALHSRRPKLLEMWLPASEMYVAGMYVRICLHEIVLRFIFFSVFFFMDSHVSSNTASTLDPMQQEELRALAVALVGWEALQAGQ